MVDAVELIDTLWNVNVKCTIALIITQNLN